MKVSNILGNLSNRNRADTVGQTDRRTDGQTDRRTDVKELVGVFSPLCEKA